MSSKPALFVHVEEPSMEAALRVLLPRMVGGRADWRIINHGNKQTLLSRLPSRLKGYANWPADWRVLVLVDRDQDDCLQLKRQLEDAARSAGIATKTTPDEDSRFRVVNRIVVEELEAWFFGDPVAVGLAYRRAEGGVEKRASGNPDAIQGGTWEALERILRRGGYISSGSKLPKIEVARAIAANMQPENNRSPSFQAFRQGLDALLAV